MLNYKDYFQIYTDGSKKESKVAFGVYCELGSKSNRIRNDCSIFTAEIDAINITFKYIRIRLSHSQNKKCVIFCDSKSVLESIVSQDTKNPLMIDILDMLQNLQWHVPVLNFVGFQAMWVLRIMKKLMK